MLLARSPSPPAALAGRWRAMMMPLGVAAAALVGAGYVGAVDPNAAGHYPTCPFLAVTGWYCPGCGALRAVHALAHGDLVSALARNPFTVIALGYVAVIWLLWLQRRVRARPAQWLAPPWVLYAVLVTILLFGVLRNLPGWTWLSPA